MAKTTKNKDAADSFEGQLAHLEELVAALESGDLRLEEAVKTFEEGMAISKKLGEILEQAERKIEILLAKEGGGAVLKPFDPDESEE
jgi:exodeoxyribonuclease VII small subunit